MASDGVMGLNKELSYWHHASDTPYVGKTIPELFDETAAKHPNKTAAIFYSDRDHRHAVSFQQLKDNSLFLAAGLQQQGCCLGDNVGLISPNSLEFITAQLALHRLGATVVMLRNNLVSDQNFQTEVKRLNIKGIVICNVKDPRASIHEGVKVLREVLKFIVTIGPGCLRGTCSLEECIAAGRKCSLEAVTQSQAEIQMDQSASIMMTSGSTGQPKAVVHSHFSLLNSVYFSLRSFNMTAESIIFNDRPLSYVIGFLLGTGLMYCGTTIVTMETEMSVSKGNTEMILTILQNEKCTHSGMYGYAMYDIIKYEQLTKFELQHLKIGFTGGQKVPEAVLLKMAELLPHVHIAHGYGCSEAPALGISVVDQGKVISPSGSVGVPPEHMEVQIVNENGQILPLLSVGELFVRGFTVFSGYYGNKEATNEVMAQGGWYKTGDYGYLDENKHIFLLGRNSDMIKRATMKVFPSQIELILAKNASIKQIIAVGVPDERLGEELCACVLLNQGIGEVTSEILSDWCRDHFKTDVDGLSLAPKYFVILDKFPQTSTGKVDRKVVKEIAIKKLGL